MPPIVIPPLVKLALGVTAVAAVTIWIVREHRRINAELDRVRPVPATDQLGPEPRRKLRRDPASGVYRAD